MSHAASEFRNSNQTRYRTSKSFIARCKLVLLRWFSPLQRLISSDKGELPRNEKQRKRFSVTEMVDDLFSENPTTRGWALRKTRQLMVDFPDRLLFNVIRIKTLSSRNWRLKATLASVILQFEHPVSAFGSEFTPILIAQLSYPDTESIRCVFDAWRIMVSWRHRELDCLVKLSVIKSIVNQTKPNTSVTALRSLAALTGDLFSIGGTLCPHSVYEELIPAFKYLVKQTDTEVLYCTAWAVDCFVHLGNRQRELLIDAGILYNLIPLISRSPLDLGLCVIEIVCQFIEGHYELRQAVWEDGFVKYFPQILRTGNVYPYIWVLICLCDQTVGSRELLWTLLVWGLLEEIMDRGYYGYIPTLTSGDLMKFCNCTEVQSVMSGCLVGKLCNRLGYYGTQIPSALHILSKTLSNTAGQLEKVKKRISVEKIQKLQWSVNDDESRLSYHIMEDYFG